MIDLENIKRFLLSLEPVTQMHFQIFDGSGKPVLSTASGAALPFPSDAFQDLYRHIIDQNNYRYQSWNAGHFLCGGPFKKNQEDLGALVVFGKHPAGPAESDAVKSGGSSQAAKMETFTKHLIQLVEEKLTVKQEIEEMTHDLDKSFEDLYLYSKIATQIKTLRISDEMLQGLLAELLENMRVDAAFVILSNSREYNLRQVKPEFSDMFAAQKDIFEKLIASIPRDASSLQENYFIVNDSREHPVYQDLFSEAYRFLAVRVKHQEDFYGWLGLVCFNMKEIFRQGELQLLSSLAEQLAVVITNTELYHELEQFVVKMVQSLVFAIEAKDLYTRGHSERVSQYCMRMGKGLGLDEKAYNDLRWASILHDVGKIGIPESILNKKGPLTAAEFEVIKGHPAKGYEILKPVELLAGSIRGVMHHHERYDGGGYPHGLKVEEIPLAARIIAVADTFDAISSDRAYRKGKNPQEAMAIIQEVAGSQLDPEMVKVFQEVY